MTMFASQTQAEASPGSESEVREVKSGGKRFDQETGTKVFVAENIYIISVLLLVYLQKIER